MGHNGDKVLLILAVARFKKEGYLYLCSYLFVAHSCFLHASTDGISSGKILSFNTKSMLKCQEALRILKNN